MKRIYVSPIVVFLLFVLLLATGCNNSRKIPSNFDYGYWDGSTYENDFFGMSITMPEDWHIAGKEEIEATGQDFENADFVDKKVMERTSKLVELTTADLFMVSRYTSDEAEEKEESNPTIGLIIEKLAFPGNLMSRAEYVEMSRKNLAKSIPGIVIKSETTKTINGQEFTSISVEFVAYEILIHQEYLICLKNNYALLFVTAWLNDSEKKQLDSIMDTLVWD